MFAQLAVLSVTWVLIPPPSPAFVPPRRALDTRIRTGSGIAAVASAGEAAAPPWGTSAGTAEQQAVSEQQRTSVWTRMVSRVRSVLSRCDDAVCRVGGAFSILQPRQWLRALIPRRRPLRRLRMCEEGTVKVKTTKAGTRELVVFARKEECALDALDYL